MYRMYRIMWEKFELFLVRCFSKKDDFKTIIFAPECELRRSDHAVPTKRDLRQIRSTVTLKLEQNGNLTRIV